MRNSTLPAGRRLWLSAGQGGDGLWLSAGVRSDMVVSSSHHAGLLRLFLQLCSATTEASRPVSPTLGETSWPGTRACRDRSGNASKLLGAEPAPRLARTRPSSRNTACNAEFAMSMACRRFALWAALTLALADSKARRSPWKTRQLRDARA